MNRSTVARRLSAVAAGLALAAVIVGGGATVAGATTDLGFMSSCTPTDPGGDHPTWPCDVPSTLGDCWFSTRAQWYEWSQQYSYWYFQRPADSPPGVCDAKTERVFLEGAIVDNLGQIENDTWNISTGVNPLTSQPLTDPVVSALSGLGDKVDGSAVAVAGSVGDASSALSDKLDTLGSKVDGVASAASEGLGTVSTELVSANSSLSDSSASLASVDTSASDTSTALFGVGSLVAVAAGFVLMARFSR